MKVSVVCITIAVLAASSTTYAMLGKKKGKELEKTFAQHWENETLWLGQQVEQASLVTLQSHDFKGSDPKQVFARFIGHLSSSITEEQEAQKQTPTGTGKPAKEKAPAPRLITHIDFYPLEGFFHSNYVCTEAEARALLKEKQDLEKEKLALALQIQTLTTEHAPLQSRIQELELQAHNQQEQLASLQKEMTEPQTALTHETQELQEQKQLLQKDIDDLKKQLAACETEKAAEKKDIVKEEKKIEKLEKDLDDAHDVPDDGPSGSTIFTLGAATGAAALYTAQRHGPTIWHTTQRFCTAVLHMIQRSYKHQ